MEIEVQSPVARDETDIDPIELIGDKWTLRILLAAQDGTRRFADFHRTLGIARNILSVRLRLLVREGLLRREPSAPGSSRMVYRLSEKGDAMCPMLKAVRDWAGTYHACEDVAPRDRA